MNGNEWIRQKLTTNGRDWVMQNHQKYKTETDSEISEVNYNRHVRRIVSEMRRKLQPEYKEPEKSSDVKDLDTNAHFFDIPETQFKPDKIVSNFWGSAENPNHQYKVFWSKRDDQEINLDLYAQEFLKLTESYQRPNLNYSIGSQVGRTAIISIPDIHIGKIIYGKSVGGEDYTPEKACELYLDAVNHFLSGVRPGELREIVSPFGEDFFNVDNMNSTTTKGTPQQNDDIYRMIDLGLQVAFSVIDLMLMYAPVKVISIRGNHDSLLSYFAGLAIEQRYRGVETFSIDSSPEKSKVYAWGNWAIRFVHYDKHKKAEELVLGFATQFPEVWSSAEHKEIQGGHYHHGKVYTLDSVQSVEIIFMPSLCPADLYHTEREYNSAQSAVMRIYDDDFGCDEIRIYKPRGGK